jgi:plasmid stabilization system protein ParE
VAHLKWRPQALKDLDAIEAYYLEVAPSYVLAFLDGVFDRVRLLETNPLMGPAVPEIQDPAIREVLFRGYRIIYLYDGDNDVVEILTLVHSSRTLDPGSDT